MTLVRPTLTQLPIPDRTEPAPHPCIETAREARNTRRRRVRMRAFGVGFFDFLYASCPRCSEPVSGMPKKCGCCHEVLEGNPVWELSRKNSAWILLIGPIAVLIAVLLVWPRG